MRCSSGNKIQRRDNLKKYFMKFFILLSVALVFNYFTTVDIDVLMPTISIEDLKSFDRDLENTVFNFRSFEIPNWREVMENWRPAYLKVPKFNGTIVNTRIETLEFNNYPYNFCQEKILALIIVISSPENSIKRDFIRNSWGNSKLNQINGFKILFAIGNTESSKLKVSITNEIKKNNDMIFIKFLDSYKNLTLKTLGSLKWANEFCRYASFLVKIDDDVLLKPDYLSQYLLTYITKKGPPDKILGDVRPYDPVLREGKWKVSKESYSKGTYPPYTAGPCYILPASVIPLLVEATKYTPLIDLEDVYLTGLVAKTGGITHHSILSLTNHLVEKIGPMWLGSNRIFQHNLGLLQMKEYWNKYLKNNKNLKQYVQPIGT